ncbi:hypothetical protein AC230_05830 [Streptomyces caatingaensis]|uniref:DUF4142 domain-containing protein n=1 Tax=Streptomyces caatingaensis TaxID=1678637 RepID=A0A0K9XM23_9ACTN|nr:hypothetical protein AC230_05830 [Streptomyces caatingaensis]
MHQGNLAEIAAGNDAEGDATTACVRSVGRTLVRDHTQLDGDVRTLAGKLGVSLPAGPSAEQKQQLASIKAKAGTKEYDAAWLSAQADNHAKTLDLIDRQISAGRNAEITAAAKAARPVVAMHLNLVRGGTCHSQPSAHAVPAGDGGTAAPPDTFGDMTTSTVGRTALGGVLLAGSVAWFVRRRRNRPQDGPR